MAGGSWAESKYEIPGAKLHLARAGSGKPVVVLHHETGTPDRLPFYDALAERYDVLVPHHPGYSRSERPDWMRSVRDIAIVYRGMLSELGIKNAALVGLGFGGWIAAEMAIMAPLISLRRIWRNTGIASESANCSPENPATNLPPRISP